MRVREPSISDTVVGAAPKRVAATDRPQRRALGLVAASAQRHPPGAGGLPLKGSGNLLATGSPTSLALGQKAELHIAALADRLSERAATSGISRGRHPADPFRFEIAGTDAVGTVLQATAQRAAELLGPYVRKARARDAFEALDIARMLRDVRSPPTREVARNTFALGVLAAMALDGRAIHELVIPLEDKLTIALHTAALDMHRAAVFFNDSGLQQFDRRWWRIDTAASSVSVTYRVNDDTRPSAALLSILTHPDTVCYECNLGLHVARLLTVLYAVGPEAFDRAFAGLAIGDERSMPRLYLATLPLVFDARPSSASDQFTIGAWNAFTNSAARAQIERNWNALYLGNLDGERVFHLASNGPRLRTEAEVLTMMGTHATDDPYRRPFLAKHDMPFGLEALRSISEAATNPSADLTKYAGALKTWGVR